MKAVIMAGGKGSRLRPLTCHLPKPMVPLLDRPCMEYIIDLLKRYGITEIAVTVQYLPQSIIRYFGDGRDFGVQLHFFEEVSPLGTAGSVKNAADFLDETFLVISGDALTDFNLQEAIDFHREKAALASIILTRVDVPLEYGVVMTGEDGRVTRFLEKPSWGEVFSDTVNTGIYVMEPEILSLFQKGEEYDFGKNLFPLLMERELPLYGYIASGYWSDIGSLSQYRQAQFDMLNGDVDVVIKGKQIFPRVWTGDGVRMEDGVQIEGPAFIGTGSTLGKSVKIGPQAVVGQYNMIASEAVIDRSILWNRNHIRAFANITGATICNDIQIGSGADICEDTVIGDKSHIGNLAVIRPGVKIWPEKEIAEGTVQQSSLIWGKSMFTSLFDEEGISGVPNLELIPEMVSRVASAYGSQLKPGTTVSVSCDENPYAAILKYSVISSLMAIGMKVRDIGTAPVPVVRYELRRSDSGGGIHIRSAGVADDERIILQFFDKDGLPIDKSSERKVENAFFQEDFARPGRTGLGELEPHRAEQTNQVIDFYMKEVLARVPVQRLRDAQLKIVFHCDSLPVMSVMLPILEKLGCRVITVMNRVRATIGELVQENHAHLGIRLDAAGQDFQFFTEQGYRLSAEEVLILQMLIAVKERIPMAVPVTAPSVMEEMSEQMGIPLVRTKTVLRSLLEVGAANALQVHFDGFYAVVALIQFLVEEGTSLHTVIQQLPQFHMNTETVACPVAAKGRIMRRLMEEMKGERLELVDGIKVLTDDGWALIMPDTEHALFKIVAQGNTRELADELSKRYKEKIVQYQQA